jgi:plastocyanin
MRTSLRSRFPTAALAATLACGGASGTATPTTPFDPGPPLETATVNATPALAFTPDRVHLALGGTVTFAFGSVAHDVYFDNDPAGAPPNVPGLNTDTSVTRAFTTPGQYKFYCHIHPGMQGTITVVVVDSV